ncbi:1-deoxy-D-xylulose-5-phosphate reductoisomerase [Methylotuvimicrobium alcaliphilum]|uniref:1-deoxy-D-xylulose 5-phosphate reductoisomerase n=1 Tax=Methylotuvimicrobium alcaliphilum (strain DSM 19304 / NCIMB 14124 / VKM B-2133 / 20Z) TaxID=1091494 RepID=G4T1U8_META2|nr:1-deoxy-D-xylulose-5-phosphate reductoisomerase [Methylotuvimicrobium alcaliphilum]CCE24622.1 1-deoxy-D-xylulose 5-phosphate reductoisomerase (DXP reductoisomerase) (1-deoxyxylulose-5-phosphate reductoisomerase) (2-C-methyl-D-erythritol 4-phosphate synthase) [Methylotuvimicrobium alcaliphilum 20Z]
MKGICILGATGSIGVSTLDVVARHSNRYRVVALTANNNIDLLYDQCIVHRPDYVVVVDENKAKQFAERIATSPVSDIKVLSGAESLQQVATLDSVDSVMAAIVGAAGLLPTLAAAKAGKTVLLANKEALVMSGDIFMKAVTESGAHLLPIDSEHNAIFQCMPADYCAGQEAKEARRILLTASGGPFRTKPVEELVDVTPDQAVAHPNWDMGRKISVDSATMMNKGLELIEACLLFNMSPDKIQVVIHPQSVIHSMVDYVDGTVLAQMGNPDMRIPIAHAMAWPERFDSGAAPLNIFDVKHMDFEQPDLQRFPCLRLAIEAVEAGGIMPAVLNAANEIAVAAFLDEKVRFTDIPYIIERSMHQFEADPADTLDIVLAADSKAREVAERIVEELKR